MAPLKFKAPTFPHFFLFFFVLVAALQQALTIFYCIGGSVVGFSPATRETGVQFPTMHLRSSVVKVCHANYVMKVDVTFTGYRSLKGRGHPGSNRRPLYLKSKALPLSYIPVQASPWHLQNSKHPHFPIFFSFFFVLVASLQQALTMFYRIGNYLVGFSPATRESGVRFPANAFTI